MRFGTRISEWKKLEVRAKAESDLKPFVVVPVTHAGWWEWVQDQPGRAGHLGASICDRLIHVKIMQVIEGARERKIGMVLPWRYLLIVTEEIGQDLALECLTSCRRVHAT